MSDTLRTPRQTTLRMANGGGFGQLLREKVFGAPKGYVPATQTPAEPTAPTAPQKAITGYAGGTATERRMKAAGLRNGGDLSTGAGGHVSGEGRGDKIPALYEPGEFVVSNDMLDAQPQLRDHLSGLRAQVLSAKGMTPGEADAKALRGKTLRALDGVQVSERPWAGSADSRLFARDPGPGNPNVGARSGNMGGSVNGGANGQLGQAGQAGIRPGVGATPPGGDLGGGRGPVLGAGATPQAPVNPGEAGGRLRRAADAVKGAPRAAAEFLNKPRSIAGAAGNLRGAVNGVVGKFAAPAAAAAAVSASLDTDTEAYRKRFGLETNDPSLAGDIGVRALGFASDLGNVLTFGQAGRMFRDKQGSEDVGAPADAAPTRPTPQAQPAVPAASMPAPTLRDQPSIRRVDGGSSPLFTNLAEDSTDNAALMGRGSISPQNMAAADALSARYAAERAGERAMEQAAPAQTDQGLRGGLFDTPKARRAARALDISERNATRSDNTTRRGQDMELEGRMAPIRQAGMLRQMKAQVMNAAGGDYRQAARIWAANGGDPKDFLDPYTSEQNGLSSARENLRKEFQVIDPKTGKPDETASSQAFDAVRQVYPKLESANENDRNQVMGDAKELYSIFQNARNQDKVGWDALKFWEPARPQLRSLPEARGGQTEILDGIGGMTTFGADNGDTLLTLNGKTLNLGKLNERQLELLERAKINGWGQ